MAVCVCLCDWNRLLNHASLHEIVKNSGKVTTNNQKCFERDVQSNSEQF